jgi:hypothetical protein
MNAAVVQAFYAPPICTTFNAPIAAITEFFTLTTTHPFDFNYKTAPLSDVTALWNTKEQATRLVFQP